MIRSPVPDSDEVIAILAALGDRPPESTADPIGSLELTWLIAELEQRYAVVLDLPGDRLDGIRTIADAVDTLQQALSNAVSPSPERT